MKFDTSGINAIVLAGGINRIELYRGYRPGYKGLLPFQGKPLIQYTLDALTSIRSVTRICIVGPAEEIRNSIAAAERYEFERSEETLIGNIRKGLSHFRDCRSVLVIPSDLPLATPAAIAHFLIKCAGVTTNFDAAIIWSMIPQDYFIGPFLKEKRKGFNRFKDISVCHGNLLLMTPSLLENSRFTARLERIYNARKSSIKVALAAGPLLGLSYLIGVHILRALTLAQFAKIASASFGIGLIPVIIGYPEIAVDIDEPRDYQFIIEELERREKRHVPEE